MRYICLPALPFCLTATASATGFLIRGDGDAVITREHGVGVAGGTTECAHSVISSPLTLHMYEFIRRRQKDS